MSFVNKFRSANSLTNLCSTLSDLFHGQTLIQTEQPLPFLTHQSKHFIARMGHFKRPSVFDLSHALSVLCPSEMARLGQNFAQSLHFSQNVCTPISIGESGISGKSVNTLLIRIRGPKSRVMRSPCRPNSPKPASTAIGVDRPISFPHGMALYPSSLMNVARELEHHAILEYPNGVAPSRSGDRLIWS